MNEQGWFHEPIFRETALLVSAFIMGWALLVFTLRKRSHHMLAAWASLKSWILIAPIIFLVLGLPSPWPLVVWTMVGISSAKKFFQMVGMYHRSWFVLVTYFWIALLGYLTYEDRLEFFNMTPMLFLGMAALIPLLRNSATQMTRYLGLSLMSFIFWGWSLMHMGLLLVMPSGTLIVIYLILLTEISDNTVLAAGRFFGRTKLFSKISSRVTLEGLVSAIFVALLLAWGMRHLLPDRSEKFWIAAGLIAALFGRLGGLVLSVIRKDLGIKNTGVFIFGRDDILTRTDKLIFVGPMYYYSYLFLQQVHFP